MYFNKISFFFFLNCIDFIKQAVIDIETLNKEYKSATEKIQRVAIYFGEDVNKFKIEECFALLGNFFDRIDVVAKVRLFQILFDTA